jgi:hypothetical protein
MDGKAEWINFTLVFLPRNEFQCVIRSGFS